MVGRDAKIKGILNTHGYSEYRYDQIMDGIYKNEEIFAFSEMFFLPKELRDIISDALGDEILSVRKLDRKENEQTCKILFGTKDDCKLETVKMHYESGRYTYCVSVQVGCSMGCAFCATGQMGLRRNLLPEEIVDQVLYFKKKGNPIDNVVLMGMGEPLVNPHSFEALRILIDQKRLGVGSRHVSVSTVGIISGIRKLTEELPQINIAFSLHTPFQDQRERLIPMAVSYPIPEVMQALADHIRRTNRKVFIVYLLLGGVNDSPKHAEALAALLNSFKDVSYLFHVNLVNYHRIPTGEFRKTTQEDLDRFRNILSRENIINTVRQDFGESIDAACGQLGGA